MSVWYCGSTNIFGDSIRNLSNIFPSLSLSINVRINANDFPLPEGPIWSELAGSARKGALGWRTVGPSPDFSALTSGIAFYVAACIFAQGKQTVISWLSGDSAVSCVAASQLQASSWSQHLLWSSASLQTYFAHVSHERALVTEATAPMGFYICANYSKISTEVSRSSITASMAAT